MGPHLRLALICVAIAAALLTAGAAFGYDLKELMAPHVDVLFIAGAVVGALLHYGKKRARKQTASSFANYWLKDNPTGSLSTAVALLLVVFGTLGSGVLGGMNAWMALSLAITSGYTLDSAFNKGLPPKAANKGG